jgi:hypothetical protein
MDLGTLLNASKKRVIDRGLSIDMCWIVLKDAE